MAVKTDRLIVILDYLSKFSLIVDLQKHNHNGGSKDVYALATAYAFDKCLYVNPASSYYPFEGTGQLYLCDSDSFKIVNEETGEIQESYSLIE